jgi:hypothetical protein
MLQTLTHTYVFIVLLRAGKGESSTRLDSFAQAIAASEDGMDQQRHHQGFARVAVGRAVTGGWEKARQAAAHRKNFASLAQANYQPKKATDQFGRKMLSGELSIRI